MYRNPKWSAPNNGMIDIEIQQTNGEWWPFSASPNDIESNGRELFDRAASGEFGEIAAFENIGWDDPDPATAPEQTNPNPEGQMPVTVT